MIMSSGPLLLTSSDDPLVTQAQQIVQAYEKLVKCREKDALLAEKIAIEDAELKRIKAQRGENLSLLQAAEQRIQEARQQLAKLLEPVQMILEESDITSRLEESEVGLPDPDELPAPVDLMPRPNTQDPVTERLSEAADSVAFRWVTQKPK